MKACLEIKLIGGLGNQLFQYAAGRSLAVRHKVPVLLLNTDSYTHDSLGRRFALKKLNTKGRTLKGRHFKNLFATNAKLNRAVRFVGLHNLVAENDFVIQQVEGKLGFLSSLQGFWQSEEYFLDIRRQLLEELTPLRCPPYPAWLEQENTVAVHVRRTDYLQEPRYGFLGKNYYTRAIDFVRTRLDNPFFVFFSDDIEWCKSEFKDNDFLFFNDREWSADYLQLHLMSKCRHQIIANSSFSWWGAWLNSNEEKIVVRPAKPFRHEALLYESHYPTSWIVIQNDI